jgi:hypothetical protein
VSEAGNEMVGMRVRCNRRMEYGQDFVDQGQVFELEGQAHDRKLLEMRYLTPVAKESKTFTCKACPRVFISQVDLGLHERRWHSPEAEKARENERQQAEAQEKLKKAYARPEAGRGHNLLPCTAPMCFAKFEGADDLDRHEREHENLKRLRRLYEPGAAA